MFSVRGYTFSKGAVARGHRIIFLWEEHISTPAFEIYLGQVTDINKMFLSDALNILHL